MGDFRSLSKSLKNTGKNVVENADRLVRKTTLAIDGVLVLATPVDTGRARANWQVEINGPAQGTTEAVSPTGRESIELAKERVKDYVGGSAEASIHITNNLNYIGRLNEGYSAQAPAAFVEKAVMVGVNAIRGAQITVGKINENAP